MIMSMKKKALGKMGMLSLLSALSYFKVQYPEYATNFSDASNAKTTYQKISNRVYINFGVIGNFTANTEMLIFTLPEKYRPLRQFYGELRDAYHNEKIELDVRPSGKVQLKSNTNITNGLIVGEFSFPVEKIEDAAQEVTNEQ